MGHEGMQKAMFIVMTFLLVLAVVIFGSIGFGIAALIFGHTVLGLSMIGVGLLVGLITVIKGRNK